MMTSDVVKVALDVELAVEEEAPPSEVPTEVMKVEGSVNWAELVAVPTIKVSEI